MTDLTLTDCRPEVLAFALLMEQELRGIERPGPRLEGLRPLDLAWQVREEAQQLYNAVWDAMRFRSPTEAMLDAPRIDGLKSLRQRITAVAALSACMAMKVAEACEALPPASSAAADVIAERRRQIAVKGWTPEHDDEHHDHGELAAAGSCYALAAADLLNPYSQGDGVDARQPPDAWPFEPEAWKIDRHDPRRPLVKAAALILAEIESLDRNPLPEATR